MVIKLYNSTADALHVDKTEYLSNVYEMNGTPVVVPQDIKAPVLDVAFTSTPSYNYAFIPDYSRYYYITNIEWLGGNAWRLFLSVDVLMSFATNIKNTRAVVSRLEDKGLEGNYFIDDRLTAQAATYNDTDIKLMTPASDDLSFDIGDNSEGKFIAFTAAQLSSARLSNITVTSGEMSPTFSPYVLIYNVKIAPGGQVTIKATPSNPIASVRFYDAITGEYTGAGGAGPESYVMNVGDVVGGRQSVAIKVSAPTGYPTQYTVNFLIEGATTDEG